MSDYECDKDKDKFRSPSLYDTTLESYWHEPEYTEEEMGAIGTKVITPYFLTFAAALAQILRGGIIPKTFFVTNVTHFQVFSEHGQNVDRHHISQAIKGKMGRVYVTYLADADKGQQHVALCGPLNQ